MPELSLEGKCKAAARLIEQSPPGEVNDVINDIRSIINDDETLMIHVQPALRSHNLAQLHTVEHPAVDGVPKHSSLLSEAAILPGSTDETERYVDAEGKQSFAFDHVQLVASDYQPYQLPEEEEIFRAELVKSLKAYTKNHFSTGISSVTTSQYQLLPPEPESTPAAPATTDTADNVQDAEKKPVTDVVEEQVGSGEIEPTPTPAVNNDPETEVEQKQEEVTEAGGIEKVDEDLEELKVEDEKAAGGEPPSSTEESSNEVEKTAAEPNSTSGTPKITEEETTVDAGEPPVEAEAEDAKSPAAAAVEPRKQERVENPTYTLETVGNKYNTNNFWTGRWRTRWVVDKAGGQVNGTIQVDVHYFEQGNVQLATNHTSSFPYPSETSGQTIASQIVTTISKIETSYQLELNDVYGDLGEKAFRSLRRALPVTRQKMDWEKVGGYSLGSDLTKARG